MDPILLSLEKISRTLESISNNLDVLVKKSNTYERIVDTSETYDKVTLDPKDLGAELIIPKLVQWAMEDYKRVQDYLAENNAKKSKEIGTFDKFNDVFQKRLYPQPCPKCKPTVYHYHDDPCPMDAKKSKDNGWPSYDIKKHWTSHELANAKKSKDRLDRSIPPGDVEEMREKWDKEEEEEQAAKKSKPLGMCPFCGVKEPKHDYLSCRLEMEAQVKGQQG